MWLLTFVQIAKYSLSVPYLLLPSLLHSLVAVLLLIFCPCYCCSCIAFSLNLCTSLHYILILSALISIKLFNYVCIQLNALPAGRKACSLKQLGIKPVLLSFVPRNSQSNPQCVKSFQLKCFLYLTAQDHILDLQKVALFLSMLTSKALQCLWNRNRAVRQREIWFFTFVIINFDRSKVIINQKYDKCSSKG